MPNPVKIVVVLLGFLSLSVTCYFDGSSPLDVMPCNNSPFQRWSLTPGTPGEVKAYDGRCLDIPACKTQDGDVQMEIYPCGGHVCNPDTLNQVWTMTSQGAFISKLSGTCLDLNVADGKLQIWPCSGGPSQAWSYMNQTIVNSATKQCLTAVIGPNYTNPVLHRDFPDPSVLRGADGNYYAYSTNSAGCNICSSKSQDLVHWGAVSDAMPQKPNWATGNGFIWAPDVSFHDGIYWMYFAAKRQSDNIMCIGVAKSNNPLGPFVDATGQAVTCGGAWAIDPKMFDTHDGRIFLYWGSVTAGSYIRARQLDSSRTNWYPGSVEIPVLYPSNINSYEQLVEATWLTYNPRQSSYYFLYYSGNYCCEPSAHYAVSVARSLNPTGPFEKLGTPILVMNPNDKWNAPGHNCIVTDRAGEDWIFYHSYIWTENHTDRVLMMDHIKYIDDWPQISNTNSFPSSAVMIGPVA